MPEGAGAIYLTATLQQAVGGLVLAVDCALAAPWTLLFGPSGAGKTSLLRLLAGLARPDAGRVVLEGRTLVDTGDGTWVGPAQRGIGFVGQRAALFPHMDVAANVAFALPAGVGRAARVAEMLALVNATGLARKMPRDLSGGEKQLVVLARALVAEPRWLLLDEPFTGMDGALQSRLLHTLRAWLAARGIPALYVSHAVADAFETGAEVLVMAAGKLVATGPATVVLARQREALLRQLGS